MAAKVRVEGVIAEKEIEHRKLLLLSHFFNICFWFAGFGWAENAVLYWLIHAVG